MAWLLALLVSLPAVLSQAARAAPPDGGEAMAPGAAVAVAVSSNGWHTSIVVPRAELPPDLIPEAADFPAAVYLSFGWGDAAYYQEPIAGFDLALQAALQPTPAVLHVTGLRHPARQAFSAQEVIELRLSRAQFADLAAYLDASFERDGAARAAAVAPGLYRFSFFYPATGSFHLFNTCNTWSARALHTGGVAVSVSGTVRAEDLMAQLRRINAPDNERSTNRR